MKDKEEKHLHKSKRIKPWVYFAALFINVIFFCLIIMTYVLSDRSYSEKLFEENIHNIENLNIASANAAYNYTNGMGVKVDDVVSYIKAKNLDYDEVVEYLSESNTNLDRQFQFILCGSYGSTGILSFGDYSGISVRKIRKPDGSLASAKTEIQYGSGYYDMYKCFTDVADESFLGVCFTPEFTDPDTKLKCFAVYRHTVLKDASGKEELYAVILAINSETALNTYNLQSEYGGQSAVLVNTEGDYIIKNNDYRNANFYDYIVNYNGLTLDWRTRLQQEIEDGRASGSPVNLFYKNHQGKDCVFSVAAIESGWYSITCVPLSSFSLKDDSANYSLTILLAFLALFTIDGLFIYFIGRTMSYNVAVAEQATKEANEASLAKSRFLSTMSHELRTPLNAIIGLVSLSGDSIDNMVILKDYLKKIDISSKLLLQLISDILDVSAIESNKMKLNKTEMDITRLITSLSAIYYDQCAGKGIEFNVVLKNMHSEILIGDMVRVNQVLLNFLSNAVKFTPNGGRITLSAEQVKKDEDGIVIRFKVSDTGCGITDELLSRLFKPFERASGDAARRYSGTGLGLSISKNLVELMNGQVGVESTEGVGSSFWAEIPFALPSGQARRSFSPIENLRVIAAVNDADGREYISQILSGFGVENVLTGDADAVFAQLREERDGEKPFNLCLLDWKLPDLNALDAARQLRKEYDKKELHIIILAYDLAAAIPLSLAAGVDMVLGKPVFPSALYNILEEISSGQVRFVPSPVVSYALTGKRILLVEDNKLNTEIALMQLNKVGVVVETAENGKIGYERFVTSATGYFDAILMDVQMPIMDGYQASAAIRASAHPQAKSIPIIAMTADAFAEDVQKAREAGMDEHISKPVVPENLYMVLKKHLNEVKDGMRKQ